MFESPGAPMPGGKLPGGEMLCVDDPIDQQAHSNRCLIE